MSVTSRAIAYLKASVPDSAPVDLTLSAAESPVLLPFAEDFLVAYVVDAGDRYQLVQHRHLVEDGVGADDLHRIGLENLSRLVQDRELRVAPYGAVFAVLMGGDFEASLLLLDGPWDGPFRRFVGGDYVAAAPARDVLAFCDVGSADGIAELRQVVDRAQASADHPLSNRLLLRRDGRWEPYPGL